MSLFWRNGYESTSVRMLEKEMGINQFSIYAIFGSKHGVFLESLKCYKSKIYSVFEKLLNGTDGVNDIKAFFYDSVEMPTKMGDFDNKGCLLTNTYNEFANNEDQLIQTQMTEFMDNLKAVFVQKLAVNSTKDEATIARQAKFIISKTRSSRSITSKQ